MDLNLPLRSNAGFLEGRKLLNERQYDIAIDVFSRLAESCLAANGEDSIEHAVACMEYGIALLEKEQDQPSDTLMTGNVAKSNGNIHLLSSINLLDLSTPRTRSD